MTRTIAEILANEAAGFSFDSLPPNVVHEAKRAVLDTLGVCFGGYSYEPSKITQNFAREAGASSEATVFGIGVRTSCLNAALANGVMFRAIDYGSTAFISREATNSTGHHSEAIPALIALGEWQRASGKELLTAIVLAYELFNKIYDSVPHYDAVLDENGFVHETMRAPCIMALAAGKLMGLSEAQMAHALSIAGCFGLELGMLNWCEEEITMARNLRFPLAAHNGILSAQLAKGGFKGSLNVFEGKKGLAQVVTGGKMDLEKLRRPRSGWTMEHNWIKNFAAGCAMHGLIESSIAIAKQNKISADDIERVTGRTNKRYSKILAHPETRRNPTNSFTADHSAYYCMAVGIIDGAVGPDQFEEKKLADPAIQRLSDKIEVEPDSSLNAHHAPGIVEITVKGGKTFRHEILRPKGHPMNPLSDSDIEAKFQSLADRHLGPEQISRIFDMVYNLEKVEDVGDLVKTLVIH